MTVTDLSEVRARALQKQANELWDQADDMRAAASILDERGCELDRQAYELLEKKA